ncbi:MAG: hypothetical protein IKF90_23330 [Parasporobacterium sp.]|nr:hypothetical protein [Parasporobacterium sp.]
MLILRYDEPEDFRKNRMTNNCKDEHLENLEKFGLYRYGILLVVSVKAMEWK